MINRKLWATIKLLMCLGTVFSVQGFQSPQPSFISSEYGLGEQAWVDSVFNALTPDERLGQLFMIRAHSDKGPEHIANVEAQIKKYKVGGLCFFQGTPEKQIELVNRYQAIANLPLMISMDAEWGLGMRMKASTISFPRQLMLGAIKDNQLIYEMGKEIAWQLKRTGVTVNFAPVLDVNNNAANPVINTRSFGEDRYNVTAKGYQYMRGLQENGVLACAKHFPGHGDTDVDSHLDLPVIAHDRRRLDSIELYPFAALAERGIGSVMVAHLNVPALDSRSNRPTTLSRNTITGLLRDSLGFDGLVMTDALEMKGVTKHFDSGEVEAEALLAGNDMLLLPEDLGASFREIKVYLADGRISQSQVDESVKRVLQAKYRLGLTSFTPIPVAGVGKELNRPAALALKQKLIENAITLVRNKDKLIPFGKLDSVRIATLSMGAENKTPFQQRLSVYAKMIHEQCSKTPGSAEQKRLMDILSEQDVVIIGLHNMNSNATQAFGLTQTQLDFIKSLSEKTRVVPVVFGNPYSLKYFDDSDWLLEAYDEDPMTQDAAAQALFGAIPISGRLPVTASSKSTFNTGVMITGTTRMGYAIPERVGIKSDALEKIRRIAREAIDAKATPGCVVLVAKNGKVIFNEAFGHHTYARKEPVKVDDIFDLASVTKIAASTISIMKMQDDGLINIDDPLSKYLQELTASNKSKMVIREMMAHRSGLQGWIPFYKQTLAGTRKAPKASATYYQEAPDEQFNIPVTDRLYLSKDFVASMWQQIIDSDLLPDQQYKYSDLGFYLISRLVERTAGKTLDQYVMDNFYRSLGLQTATYNPWQKFPPEVVVPSENDAYWRRQTVRGYVHDMGAAMLGGVSGHAGLFANANDLAVIMQMLLQHGQYGGEQYIRPETVKAFTTRYPGESRRGIGFDMFQTDQRYRANFSRKASVNTFGHLGFTGTAVWADPDNDLIFLFLSNRTYPSMHNYKLNRLGIRPRLQDVVYDAFIRDSNTTVSQLGK